MEISEGIKKLIREKNASNAEIARAAGVTRSAVTKWVNGTSQPKADSLLALSYHFRVPIEYFYNPTLEETFNRETKEDREVAAGQGRINDDYEQTGEWSEVRIVGDSMYPALFDGDLVKVHHVTEASPNDYAIVKVNGDEVTCKHIEITMDGIWLKAENKDVFPDKFYTVQEVLTLPVTIIGIATEIVSRKL